MNSYILDLRRCWASGAWLLVLTTTSVSCAGESPPPNPSQAVSMSTEEVIARVKRKDWTLVDQPGTVPPDAATAMTHLLQTEDPEVKELAVHALGNAGGRNARQGLIRALKDQHDVVRGAACRFLQTHGDVEDLPALLAEAAGNPDEYVREQISLVVGRIGSNSAVAPLLKQQAAEPDTHARKAIALALARLGEDKNRRAYLERLRQSDPKERALAVRDFLYINDRKLVPQILPLLDDTRTAINVGPSHGPFFIRVCDVAINVMDEFLKHPFAFQIAPARHYSPEDINSARTVLSKIQ